MGHTKSQEKWDKIYTAKTESAFQPPEFFGLILDHLKKGSVLDIACGDGATAIPLLKKGYHVTGVDISNVGLDRLTKSAKETGYAIAVKQVDLETPNGADQLLSSFEPETFDNILVVRYKPEPVLWEALSRLLRWGGTLFFITFNLNHHHKTGFSKRFCLAPEGYLYVHQELKLTHRGGFPQNEPHMDFYVYKKNWNELKTTLGDKQNL